MKNSGQKSIRLTMAQAIVKFLQVQFSERDGKKRRLIPGVFGIFGHGNLTGLGQAIEEYGKDLPYYRPCNEQSMVHTAAGFAKENSRLSTLACTSSIGPGATNMISGAACATINRLPVLLFPGDYYVTRYQGPVLQQLEHPISADVSVNDCFRHVSRFFDRISRCEQLLTSLPEAMRVLTDPAETGAVTIALPQDLQAHAYDYPMNLFEKRVWRVERRQPDSQRLKEALALLKGARRPFIIAGGGVNYSEAAEELRHFAETFGIPVGETFSGKGSIANDSAILLGGFGVCGTLCAGKIGSQADLVISIGTRLNDICTGSQSAFQNPQVKFISINVAGHDANKQGGLPIVADARETLRRLTVMSKDAGLKPNAAYLKEVSKAKEEWNKHLKTEFTHVPGEDMKQAQLIHILNTEAQAGDTVITAAGTPPGDFMQLWDTSKGRKCHLEFGYSCMGYEIPAGLGVRMAHPKGEVYSFVGDGTYLMQPTELVTAFQENLKLTVVISENRGLQSINRVQMARTGAPFGNEFRKRNPKTNRLDGEYFTVDFAKNAESMGCRIWHVTKPDELRKALREARMETRSCCIVVKTEKYRFQPDSGIWWDIATAEASKNPETKKRRAKYEADRQRQRFYY